jgi:hypothetical protein
VGLDHLMSIAAAASFLAQQWPVFACAADKRPITAHGLHDATTDPTAVREMFARPGATMIGVPTGQASGFFVVDLDVKNGAPGLEWLAANEHRIPRTRRHSTRSGGVHLLFAMPTARAIRNSASKLAPGVDVRGTGGYVIVPPSPGYSITDDTMPAEAPAWLLDLLDPLQAAPRPAAPVRIRDDGRGSPYALAALSAECDAILAAGFGSQEDTLNSAALKIGALAAGGEIDAAYAREALIAAGMGMPSQPGREPWTPQAVRQKVERAFRDGQATPRKAPPREVRHIVRVEIVPPEPPPYDAPPDWVHREPEPAVDLPPAKPANTALWVDADHWSPAEIPSRPWIVPGYMLRGSVSILSGAGSSGKSSIVVRWTIALAVGAEVGEFKPRRPVICVNYNVEDDRHEQLRRYSAALQAANLTPHDIAGRVIRCGPHDIGTLFERHPDTGRVEPTNAMVALERLLVERQADVLVCDPLAELHNAEENDNIAMRSVVAAFRTLARRLNIAVLILHHDRKGTATAGDMDRVRGGSAITAAARVVLTLTTMTKEEAEQFGVPGDQRRRHFRLDGAKSNYAPAQEAEWFRLDGYEIDNGETIAACNPWTPPSTFAQLSMADCVAILDEIHAGTPMNVPWAVRREAGEDWAGRLITRRGATEAQAKAILRAWVDAGTIIEAETPRPNSRHKRRGYVVNIEAVSKMRRQEREAQR